MASTISAGTTAGTALNIQSDTTGNLAFKTGASNVTAMTLDSNQNVTFANNVTYTGNIQGATITATTGFSGSGASLSALNASNVSTGTLSTAVLPTVPVASGGTGATTLTANNVLLGNGTSAVQVVAPGSSGNILSSNGTTWVSTAPAAGGVTSVATGNGLSGGTITSTGTLTIACPTAGSVGSYTWAGSVSAAGTFTFGSNYSAGTGGSQLQAGRWQTSCCQGFRYNGGVISGTWKWMCSTGTIGSGGDAIAGVVCRVA